MREGLGKRLFGAFLGLVGMQDTAAHASRTPELQQQMEAQSRKNHYSLDAQRSVAEIKEVRTAYLRNIGRLQYEQAEAAKYKDNPEKWQELLGFEKPNPNDAAMVQLYTQRQQVISKFAKILAEVTQISRNIPPWNPLFSEEANLRRIDSRTIRQMHSANELFKDFFEIQNQELRDHVYVRFLNGRRSH